jgi:hypothetical protein
MVDGQHEDQRIRALLLAARNQLDALWRVADQASGDDRLQVETVLKLVGAIDYALEIERYTFDVDAISQQMKSATTATAPAAAPARPMASNGSNSVAHPLDISSGH